MTIPARRAKNRRILVVDDNEDIHRDFRKILGSADTASLDEMDAAFFGSSVRPRDPGPEFELTSVSSGMEALREVRESVAQCRPYALAFVDVRMPAGWDGIETLARLWEEDPKLQAVICSAYSDYTFSKLVERLGRSDNFLVLGKPFTGIEVRQVAYALTEKWNQRAQLAEARSRLELQYKATRILLESKSLTAGISDLLRAVGEALGWPFGALWLADAGGDGLRGAGAWSDSPGGAAAFTEATLGVTWASASSRREPFAVAPIAPGDRDPRAALAAEAGCSASLVWAIESGGANIGALEYFAPSERAPDEDVIAMMIELCSKVGHFIESKRGEASVRESEAKVRALFAAIPDMLLRLDEAGICLDFKAADDFDHELNAAAVVGRSIADLLPEGIAAGLLEIARDTIATGAKRTIEYAYGRGEDTRHYEARTARAAGAEALVLIRDITERLHLAGQMELQRARDTTIRAQAEALASLASPLIPISDEIVIMPLIGDMEATRLQRVKDVLVRGIHESRARVAILDLTGVPTLGADAVGELLDAARAVRLVGADVILTGISPGLAQALMRMSVDLGSIAIHRTLQAGVRFAMAPRTRAPSA